MKKIIYPTRINKYLAYQNYGTRKDADALISKGHVFINNKKAVLGEMVKESDVVEVRKKGKKNYSYLAYYKPRGVITHSSVQKEDDIQTSVGRSDVFPLGRLDKDSEGLIILTNDGRMTEPLLSPDSNHEKEYIVQVHKDINSGTLKKLESGVNIEGYVTKKCKAKKLSNRKINIVLTEGKKHQIRRMLAALGFEVVSLKRIRIINIKLLSLKSNQSRELEKDELNILLNKLNLT